MENAKSVPKGRKIIFQACTQTAMDERTDGRLSSVKSLSYALNACHWMKCDCACRTRNYCYYPVQDDDEEEDISSSLNADDIFEGSQNNTVTYVYKHWHDQLFRRTVASIFFGGHHFI